MTSDNLSRINSESGNAILGFLDQEIKFKMFRETRSEKKVLNVFIQAEPARLHGSDQNTKLVFCSCS